MHFLRALRTSWRRLPSAWLLLVQLLILATAPLLDASTASQAVSWVLGVTALLMVANIVRMTPVLNVAGFVLVAASIVSSLVSVWQFPELTPWSHLIESTAYFYAAAGMILYMLKDHIVSTDDLFAAGAGFTLLAWGFAYLYAACQFWVPGSFTAAVNSQMPRTFLELIFLSFTSLSSTGLGDVIPISSPARVISAIQMFTGVMYMALIVSRLVGMKGSRDS